MLQSRSARLLLKGKDEGDEQESFESDTFENQSRRETVARLLESIRSDRSHHSHGANLVVAGVAAVIGKVSADPAGVWPGPLRAVAAGVKAKLVKQTNGKDQGTGEKCRHKWRSSSSAASTSAGSASRSQSKEEESDASGSSPSRFSSKRNSQYFFAEPNQTAIILDWDDSLFPTTYLLDDLRLSHRRPLKEQKLGRGITRELLQDLQVTLASLEASVLELLRLARSSGQLVLLTLARPSWVEQACRCFFPAVGAFIRQHGVRTVYAQEDGTPEEQSRRATMSDEELLSVYAEMKGRAISREVDAIYSQYEGQSWKNIISIGDSDFERRGTMMMSQDYMRSRGLAVQGQGAGSTPTSPGARRAEATEVNGHMYKVRIKTFKMLEYPTLEELQEEIDMMRGWLPKMVTLDNGFDLELTALDDPAVISDIGEVLSGGELAGSAAQAQR